MLKFTWVAMCLVYAMMVVLAVLTRGLQVNTLYHLGMVTLLCSLTGGIMLRVKIRLIFKRVKKAP